MHCTSCITEPVPLCHLSNFHTLTTCHHRIYHCYFCAHSNHLEPSSTLFLTHNFHSVSYQNPKFRLFLNPNSPSSPIINESPNPQLSSTPFLSQRFISLESNSWHLWVPDSDSTPPTKSWWCST